MINWQCTSACRLFSKITEVLFMEQIWSNKKVDEFDLSLDNIIRSINNVPTFIHSHLRCR